MAIWLPPNAYLDNDRDVAHNDRTLIAAKSMQLLELAVVSKLGTPTFSLTNLSRTRRG